MFRKTDIPKNFYSAFSEAPFLKCVDCECDLHGHDQFYTVSKHYVANEAVFEMAICMSCAAKLREQYSEKSLENIMAYVNQHVIAHPDVKRDHEESDLDIDFDWTAALLHCVFCGKSQLDCHRYEIMGGFLEKHLILQPSRAGAVGSPMMMCEDCNAELSQQLSQETRESWDRFVESHFDGPPGIEEDSPRRDPIFI